MTEREEGGRGGGRGEDDGAISTLVFPQSNNIETSREKKEVARPRTRVSLLLYITVWLAPVIMLIAFKGST